MTYSIACIAPYKELGDLFAEVCREFQKDILVKIAENKDFKTEVFDVKEIKLKKSVLTPKGPIYSDIKVFELA